MEGLPVQFKDFIERALLEEVYTTPKPGLVDQHDSGAHRDMDCQTFVKSTYAITPFILKMAYEGYQWDGAVDALFPLIKEIGIQAEQAMFQATKNVNTHKGIIFTMGILSAAAGACYRKRKIFIVEEILYLSKQMVEKEMDAEFEKMKRRKPVTHGEYLFQTYGEKGIRGEAQMGFPIISKIAYPLMIGGGIIKDHKLVRGTHFRFYR